MKRNRKFGAVCKFEAVFPGSRTRISYSSQLPVGMAVEIARIPVKSFLQAMADTYPEMTTGELPKLRKFTITFTMP